MKKKYQSRRQADTSQVAALKKMRGREAFALLMAMRTRKTKVVLDDFGEMELAGKVKDLLVIAPAGCYRTWEQAIKDDVSIDLQSRLHVHTYSSSAGRPQQRALDFFLARGNEPRVMLMNVEALSRPGPAREICLRFLGQRPGLGIVTVDESTIIKNKSKRTDFVVRRLRPLAAYRRILSGLATPRSPLDLFYQFEFLDWNILGFRSWYAFRSHIAFMKQQWFGGRSVMLIDQDKGDRGFRPEAIAEQQWLIDPHSFRVEFRPNVPSTYSIREVELTNEQRKAYNDIRQFATTELAGAAHVTATVVIAQITRMHQVLMGHVVDETGAEHILPELRTAALLEILEDHGGKAVIWASYDHDVQKIAHALAEEYGRLAVARFWGGNLKTREQEERDFKSRPSCRFMVATPDAGGRGRTWDCADLVVYYSSRDNLEHRDQSESRVLGRDKKRGVDYIDMICPGTVEEKILHALRKKINMASAINGDNWREWVV